MTTKPPQTDAELLAQALAENETLKRALTFAEGEVMRLADERLQRENRELRAALERIATANDWHPDDMQAFARKTLWPT